MSMADRLRLRLQSAPKQKYNRNTPENDTFCLSTTPETFWFHPI